MPLELTYFFLKVCLHTINVKTGLNWFVGLAQGGIQGGQGGYSPLELRAITLLKSETEE